MSLCGSHVLAKGDDIDIVFPELLECIFDLLVGFSETKHDGGLGDERGDRLFGGLENEEGLAEGGAGVTDEGGEGFDGFDVVGVDVEAGAGNDADVVEVSGKVTSEGFDEDVGGSGEKSVSFGISNV